MNFEKVEIYQVNENSNFKHQYNWYSYLIRNHSASFCFIDTMRLIRPPNNYNASVYVDINDIALLQEFSGKLRFRTQTITVSNISPIVVQFGDGQYRYCADKIISKVVFSPLDFRFDSGDIKCYVQFKNTLLRAVVHYERSPFIVFDSFDKLFDNYGYLLCIRERSLLVSIPFIRERFHRFMKKQLHSTILYFHFVQLQHEQSLAEIEAMITCLKEDIFVICKYLEDAISCMTADTTAYKLYCLFARLNTGLNTDKLYNKIRNDLFCLARENHRLFYRKVMYCVKLHIPVDPEIYSVFCKWISCHKFNALWYNEVIHNIVSMMKYDDVRCVVECGDSNMAKCKIMMNHTREMLQCKFQKTESLRISCVKICKYLYKALTNSLGSPTSSRKQIMEVFNNLRSEILLSFPRSKKLLLPMIHETIQNIESEYLEKYFGGTKQISIKNIHVLANIYFIHMYANDCTPILNVGLEKILDTVDTQDIKQWGLDDEFLRRVVNKK